ncbi:MAG: SDR family oxidoreductase [Candidatus Rokubacteria bacterium]|nr:SDR family oxidoreductase [Candidatus Rokubacteria bacterium]
MARTVLVAGASGLVGFAAAQHFARLPGWKVIAVSRRLPDGLDGVELVSVDLTDATRCAEVFGRLRDVTHLVYAALYEKPGLFRGWRERDQMDTNLRMLQHLFEPLRGAARGLEHVTLLQGTKAYGAHLKPIPIPAKERAPRDPHENFYWKQEDYLRAQQRGQAWRWTILRPQVIFGESLGSHMNMIPALGVYAALLREAGRPLSFPGGPPWVREAVDADLLARACEWAATTPACGNEIFNVNNGDVFEWRHVWPAIAETLGMHVGPDEPMSLAVEMPPRETEWQAIVRKYRLASPERFADFVGQGFIYADGQLAYGARQSPPTTLVSTIKARQFGFHDCMDTEDMFRKWFRRFQERRWLPPPA